MIHSASALRDWKRNRNLLKGYDDCFSVNIADACARRRETRTHHVRTAQNELDGAFVNLHVRQQKRICTTRPNNIHKLTDHAKFRRAAEQEKKIPGVFQSYKLTFP